MYSHYTTAIHQSDCETSTNRFIIFVINCSIIFLLVVCAFWTTASNLYLLWMRSNSLAIERLDLWSTSTQRHQDREQLTGEYTSLQYWWESFINMSNDRKLSAMMDDVGCKRSDGFLCLHRSSVSRTAVVRLAKRGVGVSGHRGAAMWTLPVPPTSLQAV